MAETPRIWRLVTAGCVLLAGAVCAVAFCYLRPFDSYLLRSWESELSTVADQDVEIHLEQIAAIGERSLPTLVTALHSERQIVSQTAAAVLQRKLGELELRSTDESSRVVADLARELAAHSNRPGPHSGPASNRLATRFLLWPIDRESIDGERLVADCELIIRSTRGSARSLAAEQLDEEVGAQIAGGSLPVRLTDAPPLLPQATDGWTEPPTAPTTEPQEFTPVPAPRALDALPDLAADKPATRQSAQLPTEVTARPDLGALADLDVMRKLANDDESLAREAVDELHRRGFQTKHFRLAKLLIDPDANVRLQLIQSLPQMSGIESRPWLLWLSRDEDPVVRKAAVAVIATSADPALLQRVRELEREETDDEVLRVVRQISNSEQKNTIR